MRNKVIIALDIAALMIGALSFFEGWGSFSQVLILTACAIILNKNFISQFIGLLLSRMGIPMRPENENAVEHSNVIVAFGYVSGLRVHGYRAGRLALDALNGVAT